MLRILPSQIGLAILVFGGCLYLYDFLKPKSFPAVQFYSLMCVSVALALGFLFAVPRFIAGPPLERKITLYERYGGEWHMTNDTEIMLPKNNSALKNRFVEGKEYRFTPMVDNKVPGKALIGVYLFFNMPKELTISPTRLWRTGDVRSKLTSYYGQIGNIPSGMSGGIDESFFIRFPGPGKYPIHYVIVGVAPSGFSKIERQFIFELAES